MLSMKKFNVKIYENGIQGLNCASILIINRKKEYDIKYSEIEKIHLNQNCLYDTLTVWTTYKERYGIIIGGKNGNELV